MTNEFLGTLSKRRIVRLKAERAAAKAWQRSMGKDA